MVSPFISCTTRKDKGTEEIQTITGFTLPELPYEYPALEPHIDARTMEIHYSRHHAGYVDNLNTALEKSSFKSKSLESILNEIVPGETAIRNNGGGHYNHTLFWNIMDPKGGGDPEGEVAGGIERDLGSIDQFRESFSDVAASVFGSGWAWLCKDGENRLFITSTPNQDNPLMTKIVGKTGIPILGIDVWEHAYYLKYQNRRAEYISSFFNVINWQEVNRRYLEDL
ncbi:MAG: superoxide dismutase [Cyclobacteriaceae bacterium]|nr:superoxide dismutase [Cyclobacteriaceae bacterium]